MANFNSPVFRGRARIVFRKFTPLSPQSYRLENCQTATGLWRSLMAPHSRFLMFVALFTWAAYGQVDRANLNGTVTDTTGAVVPKARVQVLSPDSGFRRDVETGPSGAYNVTGLPIGT